MAVGLLAAILAGPAVLAADITDIGYVDQGALASTPSFTDANKQLAAYKAQLDKQFVERMRSVKNPSDQQRVAQEFSNKLADRQRPLFGPLLARAQVAIASVAASKNLSVVVDKRIIIVGGQDVTRNVLDLLTGVGDPVPPVNTPPPSSVGYVDQTQIDQVDKLKKANEEFQKFRSDPEQQAKDKMKTAKSDADRNKIREDFQKALTDRQKAVIDPLVEQTRSIIATVAKKKNLVLVIDKSYLIDGGIYITSDVSASLK